jgi:hypothetical protein
MTTDTGKPDEQPETDGAARPVPLLIQGLIAELPLRTKPFSRQARERWLAALKVNLDLVYGDEDEADE